MTDKVTVESARAFVSQALEGFVYDPADSDFQKGYLEALYSIGRHGLGMDLGEEPRHKPSDPPARNTNHLTVVK